MMVFHLLSGIKVRVGHTIRDSTITRKSITCIIIISIWRGGYIYYLTIFYFTYLYIQDYVIMYVLHVMMTSLCINIITSRYLIILYKILNEGSCICKY
jgi:hypothetical protein